MNNSLKQDFKVSNKFLKVEKLTCCLECILRPHTSAKNIRLTSKIAHLMFPESWTNYYLRLCKMSLVIVYGIYLSDCEEKSGEKEILAFICKHWHSSRAVFTAFHTLNVLNMTISIPEIVSTQFISKILSCFYCKFMTKDDKDGFKKVINN